MVLFLNNQLTEVKIPVGITEIGNTAVPFDYGVFTGNFLEK
jgi:hypothetical protein